jgi:hypothetical protein
LQTIDSFLTEWAAAELAGDSGKLEALLASDFAAVGPLGFILPREDWLARHRQGNLIYQVFDLDEIQTRQLGEAAVVIARNNTRGAPPIPGPQADRDGGAA